jgi:serine/threonine protein kinase
LSLGSKRDALRKLLPPEFLREKKYEIGNVVAQGGMGAILSARESTIERSVAMKVMLDGASPDDLLRFISEAKVTGQLEHPNIVPVHELSVDESEQVFYTMKFVRGITLKKVLDLLAEKHDATLKKYPLGQLLTVFQKVCDAIAFAHSKGVIHRDLKPENFMIGDYGEVLVMDWGLAKVLDPTRNQAVADSDGRSIIRTGLRKELAAVESQSTNVMGTPQYMAPEQAYAAHDSLDPRTDIYALGAILHTILTLRPPIAGDEAQDVLSKAARGEFEAPLKATTGKTRLPHLPGGRVPEALSAVTMKAMALKQEDRYQTVPEFQAEIEAYQNGFATSAEKAGPVKQLLLLFKRHRLVAGSVAIILVLLACLLAQVVISQRRAAQTLIRLRAAAPAFAEQARGSLTRGQTIEAVEKISFAADLAPENPDYARLQADALLADQRLFLAASAYRRTLTQRPDDAAAQESLALVEKLLGEHANGAGLSKANYEELAALAQKQSRPEAKVFRALADSAK